MTTEMVMTEEELLRSLFMSKMSQAVKSVMMDDGTIDIKRTIEACSRELISMLPASQAFSDYYYLPEQTADLAWNYLLDRMANPGIPGLDTGFPTLNNMLGGFEKQNIYIFNSAPGSGKTTIMAQMAWHIAHQTPVIYFTPEARAKDLSIRLLSAMSGVGIMMIRRGDVEYDSPGYKRLEAARKMIAERPLIIYDMPEISIDEMNRVINHTEKKLGKKVEAIFVDYLQQMNGDDSFQMITNNMKGLETLTVKRDVATVMASQVGRSSGDGGSLSAGKGSGKIEELATGVLGFIIPEKKVEEDGNRRILVCTKNRHEGVHFAVNMRFNPQNGWLSEEGMAE